MQVGCWRNGASSEAADTKLPHSTSSSPTKEKTDMRQLRFKTISSKVFDGSVVLQPLLFPETKRLRVFSGLAGL